VESGRRFVSPTFEYPTALKYKVTASRPAQYDVESGWTYATVGSVNYDLDADSRELARSLVTNWILLRWADILREGLRAKIYKRLSDQLRAQTSYSLYSQLRQGLYTSEAAELQGG
jgi:predicted DCC family thiol-disulfide oxidoreductase YuxK